MPSRVTTTWADTTQIPQLLIWTRVAGSHWPSPKMTRSRMRCTTGSTLGHSVTLSPRHRLRWWSLVRITVSHRISRRLVACPLPVSQRQTTIFRHRPRRRKSQSTPGEEGHEYLCVHSCITVNKPSQHWQITFELINLQCLDKSLQLNRPCNWYGKALLLKTSSSSSAVVDKHAIRTTPTKYREWRGWQSFWSGVCSGALLQSN